MSGHLVESCYSDSLSPNNVAALCSRAILALFTLTLFVSSSLLAAMEPMFARMVLPLLGGTPAVWNTCLVFFQAVLLAGYAYGHWSMKWLGSRRQATVHIVVLLIPMLVLPIALPRGWSPPVNGNPVGWLLLILSVAIGLPYFAVSTSAPVIQRWFSRTNHHAGGDPYFLYAASNLGSMTGLLSYPVLVEPFLGLHQQCMLWTAGYAVLAGLTLICMVSAGSNAAEVAPVAPAPIAKIRRFRWVCLAFIPSSQLLGVTTFITSDIAAVPLLWIVPLSIYFLTFIFVFSRRPLIPHRLMVRLLPMVMVLLALLMLSHAAQPVGLVLAVHLIALFVSAMVCHGELAKDRPPADRLTDFYLMLSIGGVCGGLFNALLAPLIFSRAVEYPIALVLACTLSSNRRDNANRPMDLFVPGLVGALVWGLSHSGMTTIGPRILLLGVPVLIAYSAAGKPLRFAACMAAMLFTAAADHGDILAIRRSFFGIHRIVRVDQFNELYHGTTIHGKQHINPLTKVPIEYDRALTYYYRTGPIGQLLTDPKLLPSTHRVGVVGLGVGSLAAYAKADTRLTYYEIDPAVIWVAQASGYFSFLQNAKARGADVRITPGDARLTLVTAPAHETDLLVLDAFSGDAVPVHLLTRQAMEIYRSRLAEHGVLAIHISNMYLDLLQVTAALAADGGWSGLHRDDLLLSADEAADGKLASQWVILAKSPQDLAALSHDLRWRPLPAVNSRVWTDDYSNILSVIRGRSG